MQQQKSRVGKRCPFTFHLSSDTLLKPFFGQTQPQGNLQRSRGQSPEAQSLAKRAENESEGQRQNTSIPAFSSDHFERLGV